MKKGFAAGANQRAINITQDQPSQTSEGGNQSPDQAYRTSRFGRSVQNLLQSRAHLTAPLKVRTRPIRNVSSGTILTKKKGGKMLISTPIDGKKMKKMFKTKKKWPPKNDADDMKKKHKTLKNKKTSKTKK